MSNKKIGNGFEAEFCEKLFQHGYWVHNLAQNAAGQPADVIAVKNGVPYLIDCKVCSGKTFSLSRIEENQDLSMTLWEMCGNGQGWFALLLEDEVFMIPHVVINRYRKRQASFNEREIRDGIPLDLWIKGVSP